MSSANRPVYLNAARAADDPSTCPKSHLYLASVLCQNMVGDERVQRMSQWLIDDRGKVWTRVDRLRAALGTALGPAELYKYAVENLGYVAIEDRRRAIWLKLRPRAVSQTTLAAVLYWIGECSAERIVVSSFDGTWQHKVVGSAAAAIERLAALEIGTSDQRRGDFLRQRLTGEPKGELLDLVEQWRANQALQLSHDLLQGSVGGRYMILRRTQWSRRLEIRDVGRGFIVYDDNWLAQAVGLRFEDQPDYLYGKWAAEAYYEASETQQPIIDNIDALIDTPGRGKSRVQYQRLVLPFREPSGDHVLLCASLIDRSIDLRVEAA